MIAGIKVSVAVRVSSFAILLKVYVFCGVIERRPGRVSGSACFSKIVLAGERALARNVLDDRYLGTHR
jgi:hypothetical protein